MNKDIEYMIELEDKVDDLKIENEQLKQQIEKMKCYENSKCNGLGCKYIDDRKCTDCNYWELAE